MLLSAKRLIVLVVEDDRELRQLFRSTLTIAGYAVMAVEDGLGALRVIDQGTVPSAVVLDIGLPRVGGYDVKGELGAHVETRGIPIVVVTGSDVHIDEREFACVLRKPIHPDVLLDAVSKCLRAANDVRRYASPDTPVPPEPR
jgi:CheY-like chemotaxis protein